MPPILWIQRPDVPADRALSHLTLGTHQPIRKTVAPEIPDKLYFRIGDVSKLCEVPAYVLRFWETEFPQLRPNKGGTGQRLYRKRDVEMAMRIKSLLYDQGYTSVGCEPCTAIPQAGADPRSGRWGGKKLECGIHTFSEKG